MGSLLGEITCCCCEPLRRIVVGALVEWTKMSLGRNFLLERESKRFEPLNPCSVNDGRGQLSWALVLARVSILTCSYPD